MPRGTDRSDEAWLQGRLWTPQVVRSALVSWLDASDVSTITVSSGTDISVWADKSGFGRNATQPTATDRPQFDSARRAVFAARASNDFFWVTLGTGTYDALIVSRPNATGDFRTLLQNSNEQHPVLMDNSSALGAYTTAFRQAGSLTWNGLGLGYLTIRSATDIQMSRDGSAFSSCSSENLTLTTGAVALLNVDAALLGNQGWGYVHEIVATTVSSTSDPRLKQILEGYAAWKWTRLGIGDLIGLLPGSHPFKNRPPLIGD